MVKIIDQPGCNAVLSIAITALSNRDWLSVIDALEAKLLEFDEICWYLEMEDFGQHVQIDPFPYPVFDKAKRDRFDRIALVADPVWHGRIHELIQPLAGDAADLGQTRIHFFFIKRSAAGPSLDCGRDRV